MERDFNAVEYQEDPGANPHEFLLVHTEVKEVERKHRPGGIGQHRGETTEKGQTYHDDQVALWELAGVVASLPLREDEHEEDDGADQAFEPGVVDRIIFENQVAADYADDDQGQGFEYLADNHTLAVEVDPQNVAADKQRQEDADRAGCRKDARHNRDRQDTDTGQATLFRADDNPGQTKQEPAEVGIDNK